MKATINAYLDNNSLMLMLKEYRIYHNKSLTLIN